MRILKSTTLRTMSYGTLALGALAFFSLGCGLVEKLRSAANTTQDNRASSTPINKAPRDQKLYESADDLHDFISQVTQTVGSENPNVLKLTIYDDYAMVEVQDPKKQENIDGYTYRDGKLSAPNPVKIIGSG